LINQFRPKFRCKFINILCFQFCFSVPLKAS
jgi:hypothetical protein